MSALEKFHKDQGIARGVKGGDSDEEYSGDIDSHYLEHDSPQVDFQASGKKHLGPESPMEDAAVSELMTQGFTLEQARNIYRQSREDDRSAGQDKDCEDDDDDDGGRDTEHKDQHDQDHGGGGVGVVHRHPTAPHGAEQRLAHQNSEAQKAEVAHRREVRQKAALELETARHRNERGDRGNSSASSGIGEISNGIPTHTDGAEEKRQLKRQNSEAQLEEVARRREAREKALKSASRSMSRSGSDGAAVVIVGCTASANPAAADDDDDDDDDDESGSEYSEKSAHSWTIDNDGNRGPANGQVGPAVAAADSSAAVSGRRRKSGGEKRLLRPNSEAQLEEVARRRDAREKALQAAASKTKSRSGSDGEGGDGEGDGGHVHIGVSVALSGGRRGRGGGGGGDDGSDTDYSQKSTHSWKEPVLEKEEQKKDEQGEQRKERRDSEGSKDKAPVGAAFHTAAVGAAVAVSSGGVKSTPAAEDQGQNHSQNQSHDRSRNTTTEGTTTSTAPATGKGKEKMTDLAVVVSEQGLSGAGNGNDADTDSASARSPPRKENILDDSSWREKGAQSLLRSPGGSGSTKGTRGTDRGSGRGTWANSSSQQDEHSQNKRGGAVAASVGIAHAAAVEGQRKDHYSSEPAVEVTAAEEEEEIDLDSLPPRLRYLHHVQRKQAAGDGGGSIQSSGDHVSVSSSQRSPMGGVQRRQQQQPKTHSPKPPQPPQRRTASDDEINADDIPEVQELMRQRRIGREEAMQIFAAQQHREITRIKSQGSQGFASASADTHGSTTLKSKSQQESGYIRKHGSLSRSESGDDPELQLLISRGYSREDALEIYLQRKNTTKCDDDEDDEDANGGGEKAAGEGSAGAGTNEDDLSALSSLSASKDTASHDELDSLLEREPEAGAEVLKIMHRGGYSRARAMQIYKQQAMRERIERMGNEAEPDVDEGEEVERDHNHVTILIKPGAETPNSTGCTPRTTRSDSEDDFQGPAGYPRLLRPVPPSSTPKELTPLNKTHRGGGGAEHPADRDGIASSGKSGPGSRASSAHSLSLAAEPFSLEELHAVSELMRDGFTAEEAQYAVLMERDDHPRGVGGGGGRGGGSGRGPRSSNSSISSAGSGGSQLRRRGGEHSRSQPQMSYRGAPSQQHAASHHPYPHHPHHAQQHGGEYDYSQYQQPYHPHEYPQEYYQQRGQQQYPPGPYPPGPYPPGPYPPGPYQSRGPAGPYQQAPPGYPQYYYPQQGPYPAPPPYMHPHSAAGRGGAPTAHYGQDQRDLQHGRSAPELLNRAPSEAGSRSSLLLRAGSIAADTSSTSFYGSAGGNYGVSVDSTGTGTQPGPDGHVVHPGRDDRLPGSSDEKAVMIALMVSKQEELFGCNMYDSLTEEDEPELVRLRAAGYDPDDAIMRIFEMKGFKTPDIPKAEAVPIDEDDGPRAEARYASGASTASQVSASRGGGHGEQKDKDKHGKGSKHDKHEKHRRDSKDGKDSKDDPKKLKSKRSFASRLFGGNAVTTHEEGGTKLRYRDADVKRLIKMGFTRDQAIQALIQTDHDVQRAANILLGAGGNDFYMHGH